MPPCKDSIPDSTGINSSARDRHPLLAWTFLRPGATVALQLRKGQKLIGIVETGTPDGLVIWIRTELNERRMVHLHDCASVQILDGRC